MRRRKGSILIYVMMIFSVLMIMGTTLLMLTMQNVKNRRYYANSRENRYYSESGIDEAEGILRRYIELAEAFAVKNTDEYIEGVIETDKVELEKINNLRLSGRESEIDPGVLKLFDVNGEIKNSILENMKQDKFQSFYIGYFNNLKNSNKNFINMINDIEGYEYEGVDGERVNVTVDNKVAYAESDAEITGAFKLDLSSKFIKDGVHKEIKVCYEITVPEYSSMQTFSRKYMPVSMTPLISRSLIVDNNALIDGEISVVGDVYVKGNPDDGVIMESQNARLNISSGSLIAAEGIRYSYDYEYNTSIDRENQGAKISLMGGNLYTKNILFEKQNIGSQGAELLVDGKVYVKDDLQIYSEFANVDVWEYNGISDGSVAIGDKIDNSSAIVLNTREIGPDKTTVNIKDNLWLAGVAYIEGLEDPAEVPGYAYQTGESITVKGNYLAYDEGLKNSYIVDSSKFGKRDIKYETGKLPLQPLNLVTYYDSETRWYSLYESSVDGDEKLEIVMGFKDNYMRKFPEAKFFSIDGLNQKIPIGVKTTLELRDSDEVFIDRLKSSDELDINIYNSDKITSVGDIKIFRLDHDFIVSLYVDKSGDKRIYLEQTPRWIFNKNLKAAKSYTITAAKDSGEKNKLGVFVDADDHAKVNDMARLVFYNRGGGREFEVDNVQLQDYKKRYMNMDSENKSEIFAKYVEDNKGNGKLKGFEGINIGNKGDKNIITGTIIDGDKVLKPNYYDNPNEYDKVFKRKEAIARDKLYYMDAFEKKYEGNADNIFEDRTIEDLSVEEYNNGIVVRGEHPERDYVVTPEDYVNLSGDTSNNVHKLSSDGVYINYNANGVIMSNKTEVAFGGKEVLKVNDIESGIIIIKGDLLIKGDFTFSGSIIVMGNLRVDKDADVNIYYSKMEIAEAVANGKLFENNILKEDMIYKGEEIQVELFDSSNSRKPKDPLKQTKWVVVR